MLLAFLFAAALAVAKIHASQITMDAKIRDDSDLSQVKRPVRSMPFSRYRHDRHVAVTRHEYCVSLNRHAGTIVRARVAFK